jgi:hypothetical protein
MSGSCLTHAFGLAGRYRARPELMPQSFPLTHEGAGKAGCQLAPAVRVNKR